MKRRCQILRGQCVGKATFRRLFRADGATYVDVDYNALEMRILSELMNKAQIDPDMIIVGSGSNSTPPQFVDRFRHE